jgi:small subunit ribosomal protein S20
MPVEPEFNNALTNQLGAIRFPARSEAPELIVILMPNTKSAERRMRSSARRHAQNQSSKARLKTLEKKYLSLVASGKKDEASTLLRSVNSALDKASKSGVVHANTASRKKSRLTLKLA